MSPAAAFLSPAAGAAAPAAGASFAAFLVFLPTFRIRTLGRLNGPMPSTQRSSDFKTAILSALFSTFRERAKVFFRFKLLSIDILTSYSISLLPFLKYNDICLY